MYRRYQTRLKDSRELRLRYYELNRERLRRKLWSTEKRRAVKQGYEEKRCPECSSYTLVRNGSVLKCNTCGTYFGFK